MIVTLEMEFHVVGLGYPTLADAGHWYSEKGEVKIVVRAASPTSCRREGEVITGYGNYPTFSFIVQALGAVRL